MRHTLAAGRVIVLLAALLVAGQYPEGGRGAADEPKTAGAETPGVAKATSGNLVTGVVLDPAGAPVAGCKVWGHAYVWIAGVKTDAIDEATTDREGRFGFPNADEWGFFARDGKGRIGWPISNRQWRSARGTTSFSIQLIEGRDYRGRLVDTSGRPIAKAQIRPESFESKQSGQLVGANGHVPPKVSKEMACESGPDGSFVLRGVPTEGTVHAALSARGFGSYNAEWSLSTPTTIRLAPAGSVRGTVVCEADPKAVAGVTLRLNCRGNGSFTGPSPWEDVHLQASAETSTQKDGSFVFAEVPPGEYWLIDTWVPNASYYLDFGEHSYPQVLHVKSREVTSIGSITQRPTVPIHGTVVDAKSDAGIPDVVLDVPLAGLVRTDAQGAYSARVRQGTLRIWVKEMPERYGTRLHPGRSPSVSVDVAKDTTIPPICLQPMRTMEGTVVDESGNPVADAEVVPFASGWYEPKRPRSDQSGKFIVTGAPDDASVQLRARTRTAVTDAVVTVRPGDGPVRLVVSEKSAFRLRGSVVDERGRPVGDATVGVSTNWRHDGRTTYFTVDDAETDARGRFESVLWLGGQYGVNDVKADGFGTTFPSGPAHRQINATRGAIQEVPPIVLVSQHGSVQGTVVDSAGKPLAGVRVFNNGDAHELILVRTDAAGRFRLQALEPGPVYVFASMADYRFTGVRTTAGATGLVVKLLRKDEPVPPWPRPKPPTYKEQQEFARRCLMKMWPLGDQPDNKETMILGMARIDFEQARKWSEASGGTGRVMLQWFHIDMIAEADAEEAIKLVRQFQGDYVGPCDVLWMLGRRYATGEPAKSLRFATEMASLARRLGPSARARQLSRAGAVALASGGKDAGRKWIEEAAALLPGLRNTKDYTFVLKDVAEAMAGYDPRSAAKLLERNGDEYWLSEVAVAGCLVDLEYSLQIVGAMKPDEHSFPRNVDRARLRIACRLAATEPEQAVKLVEEIADDFGVRARSYARLAVAMAPHHKAMAWSLMDRALAVGSGMDFRPGARIGPGPTSTAADFAVWAHQIGYPDMEGAVDRVLACRPNGRERFPDDGREEMIDMAAKLALVDPETGREILRYIDQRLELTGTQLTPIHGGHLWLTAWALADLKHAEELFDRAVAEPKATRRKTAWKVPPQGLLGQGLGWSGLPKMAEVLALLPSLRLRAINRHFNFGPLSYDILGGLEDEDD